MITSVDIRLQLGYQFGGTSDIARFGLYLDTALKPGVFPVFHMDMTVTPTLHLSTNRFRFSLGLGLGLFYLFDKWFLIDKFDDKSVADSNLKKGIALFEFRPRMDFDWFLTGNAFFGLGMDIPMIIYPDTKNKIFYLFNIDIHIGYKF